MATFTTPLNAFSVPASALISTEILDWDDWILASLGAVVFIAYLRSLKKDPYHYRRFERPQIQHTNGQSKSAISRDIAEKVQSTVREPSVKLFH